MSIHLSISSYAAGGSPEIAVKRLVKAGFRYSELGGFHSSVLLERSEEEWKKFRAYAEGQGLLFRQGHLPLHNDITLADEDQRRANVAVHRAYCRMCGDKAKLLWIGVFRRDRAVSGALRAAGEIERYLNERSDETSPERNG